MAEAVVIRDDRAVTLGARARASKTAVRGANARNAESGPDIGANRSVRAIPLLRDAIGKVLDDRSGFTLEKGVNGDDKRRKMAALVLASA